MKKLNTSGMTHHLLIIGVVVIFAVLGVGYMVASHADPKPLSKKDRALILETAAQNGESSTGSQVSAASARCRRLIRQTHTNVAQCKPTHLTAQFCHQLHHGRGFRREWLSYLSSRGGKKYGQHRLNVYIAECKHQNKW